MGIKEENTTEVNKRKAKGIYQSDKSDEIKGNVQENNTTTSAYFNPIIHLTPKKTKNAKNSQKEKSSKEHKGNTTGNNTPMEIDGDEED